MSRGTLVLESLHDPLEVAGKNLPISVQRSGRVGMPEPHTSWWWRGRSEEIEDTSHPKQKGQKRWMDTDCGPRVSHRGLLRGAILAHFTRC